MQRIDVQQRVQPILVELHEAYQHQRAGKEMGDIKCQGAAHAQRLPDTNSSNVASRPSIRAAPRKAGTRKTRIFAMAVSNIASSIAPTANLARNEITPTASARAPASGSAIPHGTNRHPMTDRYRSSFNSADRSISPRCRPEYSSTMRSEERRVGKEWRARGMPCD